MGEPSEIGEGTTKHVEILGGNMYELIIFTMMSPHVEPKWMTLAPTSEVVCIERKQKFERLLVQVEGLVITVTCEPVKT